MTLLKARAIPLNRHCSVVLLIPNDVLFADEPMGFSGVAGNHEACGGYFNVEPLLDGAVVSKTDVVLACSECAVSFVIPRMVHTYKELWIYLVHGGVLTKDDEWPCIY